MRLAPHADSLEERITTMTLPEHVRQAIQALSAEVSSQLGEGLERVLSDVLGSAAQERDAAVASAVGEVRLEGARAIETAVARVREEVEAEESARRAAEVALEETRAHLAAAAAQASTEAGAERARERESMLAALERLLQGIRSIDAAETLRAALDALGDAVARDTMRSLVLVRRGAELRGWRVSGFSADAPGAAELSVPIAGAGALGSVVDAGEPVPVHPEVFGRHTAPALAFAHLPESRVGLAVPVRVAGDVVAVVYADDGDRSDRAVPGAWPEVLEILARHASRRLEGLVAVRSALAAREARRSGTASPAPAWSPDPSLGWPDGAPVADAQAVASAQRYARLLVSEIKLYNETALREGRLERKIRTRLHAEIARARRMYEERAAPSLRGGADYFEHELVQTLADGNPELLGDETPASP